MKRHFIAIAALVMGAFVFMASGISAQAGVSVAQTVDMRSKTAQSFVQNAGYRYRRRWRRRYYRPRIYFYYGPYYRPYYRRRYYYRYPYRRRWRRRYHRW